jgi:hypothetical protein
MKHPRKSYTNHAENRRQIAIKWKLLSYSTLPEKNMFYGNLKALRRNHEASLKQKHQSRRKSAPNFRKMETSLLEHTTRKKLCLWKFESFKKKS